jgi:hypothetical protein
MSALRVVVPSIFGHVLAVASRRVAFLVVGADREPEGAWPRTLSAGAAGTSTEAGFMAGKRVNANEKAPDGATQVPGSAARRHLERLFAVFPLQIDGLRVR